VVAVRAANPNTFLDLRLECARRRLRRQEPGTSREAWMFGALPSELRLKIWHMAMAEEELPARAVVPSCE
jgi:hypothetical protein